MTARVWTREELDRVHPLPKGEADGIRHRPPWFWRIDASGPVAFALLPSDDWEVWVDARGCLCSSNGDPPADVALAVILASKGIDSLGAMAGECERKAKLKTDDARAGNFAHCINQAFGQARAWNEAAGMLRRGTVKP